MIAIAIINFRTLDATTRCLDALRDELPESTRIYLLDNGSGDGEAIRLREHAALLGARARFFAGADNLGFAGGMNVLIAAMLADADIEQVLLLNSDTRPTAGFLAAMLARLEFSTRADMVAARLLD